MTIFVVDDEPIIADTLVNILQGAGHDALAISDGHAAVRWAERILPDLVISDVMMPRLNGIETAKGIRQAVPDCQIILFSGQAASSELVARAAAEGHRFEILMKPINPDILLDRIARLEGGGTHSRN